LKRWDEVSAGKTWIMWDLALIESIISHHVYHSDCFTAPPENTQRMIEVITEIKPERIQENFWECLLN
jgi:hypothetical protein